MGRLSIPAVGYGRVYFGTEFGKVHALDEFTGDLVWEYSGSSGIESSPVIANGWVYVGLEEGALISLNATDGHLMWKYDQVARVESSPALYSGTIYFGSDDGNLYALNATSGELVWKIYLGGKLYSSPSIARGIVYIGSTFNEFEENFYAVNATTGLVIWKHLGADISSSPAIAKGRVFIGHDNDLYAFNATDGTLLWQFPTVGETLCSPVVADGKVFFGSLDGTIYAVDEKQGILIWEYETGSKVGYGSAAIAYGKVYFKVQSQLYCFGTLRSYQITIDPQFFDNKGNPLVPLPDYWTIQLPNGSLIMTVNPETFDTSEPDQLYRIINVTWQGENVLQRPSRSPFLYSNTTWTPQIECALPTDLTLTLSPSTAYLGFKVTIHGTLSCNRAPLSNTPLLLSYSATDGETWNDIAHVTTGMDGWYSATWTPSVKGYYRIKATWAGNATFPESSTNLSLAVTPHEEETVFSVISNSTISELSFNLTRNELSFNVSGISGTTGYVEATIAKNLIPAIKDLTIYVNTIKVGYTASSIDTSWLIRFTYQHSTHTIVIHLTKIIDFTIYLIWALCLAIISIFIFLKTKQIL
jgi:outer membrane protein assembly factor BamB